MKWTIFRRFSSKNVFGFTLQNVKREFPEKNHSYLSRTLSEMVDKDMLLKVSQGIYHIIPVHADPKTYTPGGYQVTKYLMQDKEYYIGYVSALKIHGLSRHSRSMESNTIEHVVTKTQMKPAIRRIAGTTLQFIHHDATRFFGFESIWINKLEKATVSDFERTIVDVATQPQLCGGIVGLGNALFMAEDSINLDKLFHYFARNMNKSAKKRFLFLTDLLGLPWTAEHERMLKGLGSGITLLDPSGPDRGRSRMKFGLRINVDPYQIRLKVVGKGQSE